MAVSYNKLWKLMIDKKINKSQLCKKIKISSSTMAKMTNEEMVVLPHYLTFAIPLSGLILSLWIFFFTSAKSVNSII